MRVSVIRINLTFTVEQVNVARAFVSGNLIAIL